MRSLLEPARPSPVLGRWRSRASGLWTGTGRRRRLSWAAGLQVTGLLGLHTCGSCSLMMNLCVFMDLLLVLFSWRTLTSPNERLLARAF